MRHSLDRKKIELSMRLWFQGASWWIKRAGERVMSPSRTLINEAEIGKVKVKKGELSRNFQEHLSSSRLTRSKTQDKQAKACYLSMLCVDGKGVRLAPSSSKAHGATGQHCNTATDYPRAGRSDRRIADGRDELEH